MYKLIKTTDYEFVIRQNVVNLGEKLSKDIKVERFDIAAKIAIEQGYVKTFYQCCQYCYERKAKLTFVKTMRFVAFDGLKEAHEFSHHIWHLLGEGRVFSESVINIWRNTRTVYGKLYIDLFLQQPLIEDMHGSPVAFSIDAYSATGAVLDTNNSVVSIKGTELSWSDLTELNGILQYLLKWATVDRKKPKSKL